jgi:hypothetical protein
MSPTDCALDQETGQSGQGPTKGCRDITRVCLYTEVIPDNMNWKMFCIRFAAPIVVATNISVFWGITPRKKEERSM